MEISECKLSSSSPSLHGDIEIISVDADRSSINEHEARSRCRTKQLRYQYPMKFWVPRGSHTSSSCLWLYGMQFGGGFVGGDDVHCRITVGNRCRCLYTSLGYGQQEIKQNWQYIVDENALLIVMPDPIMVYADAVFMQKQEVILSDASSEIILLDWYTAGRATLREHWSAKRIASDTAVTKNGKPIFHDAFRLEHRSHGGQILPAAMGKYTVFGTCVIIGSQLSSMLQGKLEQLKMGYAYGVTPDCTAIATTSLLYEDIQDTAQIGHVVRFCFYSTIQAYEFLGDLLDPIFSLSGGNPFERHY
ncbi:uncharacterized protein LOC129584647 isoform X2 [Paramacrobiotus metropolitanus]|uniref:uncharacterized protein LOC129584647 isoform X2 n=1 Tax=Paramacrobiotus metropolitanus TaxID=2943436 RepID=UPI002445E540|nr:uncharacterized protein LOC129584647 isoform X2 [Paramacrobiotus metropolitanus]